MALRHPSIPRNLPRRAHPKGVLQAKPGEGAPAAGNAPSVSGGGMFRPVQYNSYSGTDMLAVMHMPKTKDRDLLAAGATDDEVQSYLQNQATLRTFAELGTLSISSARSVHPVRRLGESHVFAYTRGARTVAGTMVFAMLDRDVMADFYRDNPDEIQTSAPFFVDQMPEFNIYIAAANEYGGTTSAGLVGITLTNWGQTLSVDDIYTEVTYTFVAKFYLPFVPDYASFNRMVQLQDAAEGSMRPASRMRDVERAGANGPEEDERAIDEANDYAQSLFDRADVF